MPRVGRLLGLAEQSLGEVFYGKHDIENAVLHLTEAVRILERVAEKPPVNAPSLVEAASACGSLGDVYAHGNGPADEAKAQGLFENQKTLDERALALDPASERASRGIAVAGLKLAGLIEEPQPADAAHLLESGLQRLATLQEASRRSMSNLRLAAILQTHLARAYPAIGDHAAGTEHASQAVRLYESIVAMSPGNARAQADLLNAWFSYAESADYGDATPSPQLLEQIRSAYRAALELCDGLLKNTPGNPQWMGRAAEIQFRIGRLSFALHDAAGAKAALERAHALAIEVADRV